MKILGSILALSCLVVYPNIALAGPTKDKVRAAYADQCRYMANDDWTNFFNQMAPNFRTYNLDGSVQTRTQNVSALKGSSRVIKLTSCDPKLQSVYVSGKQYTATVLYITSAEVLQGVPKSANGPALRKGDRLETKALIVDTWVDRGDGTLVVTESRMKSAQRAINGQVIK